MKKCVRALSLLLVLAIVTSMCACTAKPTRSGIKHNDAQSKPEHASTMETDPVPTTTDPVPTQPADTPTPTPADPSPAVNSEPVEMTVSDLMYISELCIGLTPDQATELLTAVLGISKFDTVDGDKTPSGVPIERFLRNLNRDISVNDIMFKSIGMYTNSDGAVVDVNFTVRNTAILDTNESFDSESYSDTLYPVICDKYGDPDDEYSSSWIDFDKSGNYGWDYSDNCWVYLFWGMGCQSVTGNDQLVLGLSLKDTSSIPEGPAEGTVDADYEDVYELLGNVTGLDIADAEKLLGVFFGTEFLNPDIEVNDGNNGKNYTYNVQIAIEGYSFYQVELKANAGNIVYHIGFTNNSGSADELHEICLEFRDMTADYLESDPTLEFPFSEDNDIIEFYDFTAGYGIILSSGGYYTGTYNSVWFTYEDTKLAQ